MLPGAAVAVSSPDTVLDDAYRFAFVANGDLKSSVRQCAPAMQQQGCVLKGSTADLACILTKSQSSLQPDGALDVSGQLV